MVSLSWSRFCVSPEVQALLALFAWDFTIWQCHLEGINKAIVSGVLLGAAYIFLVRKYRRKDPAEIIKKWLLLLETDKGQHV